MEKNASSSLGESVVALNSRRCAQIRTPHTTTVAILRVHFSRNDELRTSPMRNKINTNLSSLDSSIRGVSHLNTKNTQ